MRYSKQFYLPDAAIAVNVISQKTILTNINYSIGKHRFGKQGNSLRGHGFSLLFQFMGERCHRAQQASSSLRLGKTYSFFPFPELGFPLRYSVSCAGL